MHRAELVAHAVLHDHASGDGCGLLDVVGGTRARVGEDDLLGGASTEQHRQLIYQFAPPRQEFVVRRKSQSVAKRPTSGDDCHLVNGVSVGKGVSDKSVPRLVVGDDFLLIISHHLGLPLRARDDTVDGLFKLDHRDFLLMMPGSKQRRLVDQVGQVGSSKARSATGQHFEIDLVCQRFALGMDSQNGSSTFYIGGVDGDLAVEPAGAE